jgi:uncharacterized protein
MHACRKPLTSVLVKPAGPDCNMACGYCFYLAKSTRFSHTPMHRMDADVLDALVRQVMTQGGTSVTFAWQGGEPTLMGVEFFRQAVELQRRYGQAGQTVGNGLQTNGLLIDSAWCRFLRDARFLVGLSLDGPQHVHDRYRVLRGGQPTWARVTGALGQLLDAGVEVNALAVVTDYSATQAREIYEYLKGVGLRYMQFIPCLEHDPEQPLRPTAHSPTAEQFGRFLCDVFDCWLADFRDGQPTTSVRWFDSVFATYVDVPPPECSLLAECGPYAVVEHNGDVFACDFFVEDQWKLGNVRTDKLAALLNGPIQARFGRRKADLPRACHECRWLPHCRGGCPRERWGHPSDPKRSLFCEAYQEFFSHADAHMRKLATTWLQEQRV